MGLLWEHLSSEFDGGCSILFANMFFALQPPECSMILKGQEIVPPKMKENGCMFWQFFCMSISKVVIPSMETFE